MGADGSGGVSPYLRRNSPARPRQQRQPNPRAAVLLNKLISAHEASPEPGFSRQIGRPIYILAIVKPHESLDRLADPNSIGG
jgi:hypothetical protein